MSCYARLMIWGLTSNFVLRNSEMSFVFFSWEKIRDSIKVVWKRSLNSQTGHISQATNLSESISKDSLSECVFRSHDQSCNFSGNRDRLTSWMCFQVLWSVMQLLRKHRDKLTTWMCFQVPWSVMQLLRKHRDRLTAWMCFQVPWSVMQLLRKHRDRLTSWICFQVPWSVKKKGTDFYLPPRLQSAFIHCITSFSYCFVLGMFLHLSVHKFQVYCHLHTIVNSWLILNCFQKISSLTS